MGSAMPSDLIRDVKWRPVGQNNRYNFSSVPWSPISALLSLGRALLGGLIQ